MLQKKKVKNLTKNHLNAVKSLNEWPQVLWTFKFRLSIDIEAFKGINNG